MAVNISIIETQRGRVFEKPGQTMDKLVLDMASQMGGFGFFVIVWSRDCVIGLFHKKWIVIDVITYFR